MAWPESRPEQALLDEVARIRVELRFASLGAEVVRLAVVLAAAGSLRRIYLHPANDVLVHVNSSFMGVEGITHPCDFDYTLLDSAR